MVPSGTHLMMAGIGYCPSIQFRFIIVLVSFSGHRSYLLLTNGQNSSVCFFFLLSDFGEIK